MMIEGMNVVVEYDSIIWVADPNCPRCRGTGDVQLPKLEGRMWPKCGCQKSLPKTPLYDIQKVIGECRAELPPQG